MSNHSRMQMLCPEFVGDCQCGDDKCLRGPGAVCYTHMQCVDNMLQKMAELNAKTHASSKHVVLMTWVFNRVEEIVGLIKRGGIKDKERIVDILIEMTKRDYPVDGDAQQYLFNFTMGVLFKDEYEQLQIDLVRNEKRVEASAQQEKRATRKAADALEELASLMRKENIGEVSPVAVGVKRKCGDLSQ